MGCRHHISPHTHGERARRFLFLLLVLLVASCFGSARGRAQSGSDQRSCQAHVVTWSAECDAALEAHFCEGPIIVFDTHLDDDVGLRLELQESGQVQIVGPEADPQAHPASARALIAKLTECAAATSPFSLQARTIETQSVPTATNGFVPWSMLLGFAGLIGVLLFLRVKRRRWLQRVMGRRGGLFALALLLGSAFLGSGLFPWLPTPAYFHMNGQGPLWTQYALGVPSQYGPGFHEVFAAPVAWAGAAPEQGLFAMMNALLAFVAPIAWLCLRAARVPPALAAVLATVLACDPMRLRLAGTESYFGVGFALLMLAHAPLVLAYATKTPRWLRALAIVAAGAFIAQGARLHPILWLASALTPLSLWALAGRSITRSKQVVVAGIGVGLVTLALAGQAMWTTLHGPLGRWTGGSGSAFSSLSLPIPWLLLGAVWVAILRKRPQALRALVVALIACIVGDFALHLSSFPPHVYAAHERLFVPALVVPVGILVAAPVAEHRFASLRKRLRSPWLRPGLVAVVGAAVLLAGAPVWLRITTDAAEQNWVRSWRHELPTGATIAHVRRAENRVLYLPLHGAIASHPRVLEQSPEGADYLYIGSLCSTVDGADPCGRLLAIPHEEVRRTTLPALESYVGFGYETDPVTVRLLRVRRD